MNSFIYGAAIVAIICTGFASGVFKEEDCEGNIEIFPIFSWFHSISIHFPCSLCEDSGRICRYTHRWHQSWSEKNRRRIQNILPHSKIEATKTGNHFARRFFFLQHFIIIFSLTKPYAHSVITWVDWRLQLPAVWVNCQNHSAGPCLHWKSARNSRRKILKYAIYALVSFWRKH